MQVSGVGDQKTATLRVGGRLRLREDLRSEICR
jgi:hypothetical protein